MRAADIFIKACFFISIFIFLIKFSCSFQLKSRFDILPKIFLSTSNIINDLSSKEISFDQKINSLYEQCIKIKCPFFRRRAFDMIESITSVMRFIIINRHKSIDSFEFFDNNILKFENDTKVYNLDMTDISKIIQSDWEGNYNGKGYYITGRLSKYIYKDNCIFDGPDPDMPIKGCL